MLLSHALRHSIITAEDFRFPVRDGMERFLPRYDHQAKQNQFAKPLDSILYFTFSSQNLQALRSLRLIVVYQADRAISIG